jgi:hypothetical protein
VDQTPSTLDDASTAEEEPPTVDDAPTVEETAERTPADEPPVPEAGSES